MSYLLAGAAECVQKSARQRRLLHPALPLPGVQHGLLDPLPHSHHPGQVNHYKLDSSDGVGSVELGSLLRQVQNADLFRKMQGWFDGSPGQLRPLQTVPALLMRTDSDLFKQVQTVSDKFRPVPEKCRPPFLPLSSPVSRYIQIQNFCVWATARAQNKSRAPVPHLENISL